MALKRGEGSWILTEAAQEPFFNLVQRYVFAPYFAATLAVGTASGASLWGVAMGISGVAIALLAPLLGSIADSGSRLKPWVLVFMLLGVAASISLWWATPDQPLWWIVGLVVLATVSAELLGVFTNAFLPQVAPAGRMGLLSGLAFGLSQLAGITALGIILLMANRGPNDIANLPDRLSGPLSAAFMLVLLLPLLLFVRDRDGQRRASVGQGLVNLKATLAEAWRAPPIRWLLIARMLGADGMAVIFSFGAVLGAASFGWQAGTLAIFGIVITLFGAAGGFAAGMLDRVMGARRLAIIGLGLVAAGALSVILTDGSRLFGVPTGVPLGTALATPQEWGFMASGAVIAAGAAFAIAATRALLAMTVPQAKIAAYFGLYAFVGKATAFIGPFLVAIIVARTGSVRAGIFVALAFLAGAIFAMRNVAVDQPG